MRENYQRKPDAPNHPTYDHARLTTATLQPANDDRYPGSFFRIPGVPTPGKATWSLTK